MKVHVTLLNADNIIEPCLYALSKVYPEFMVHDFGSEDDSTNVVKRLDYPITLHGKLSGEDYVKVKDSISKESNKVFWVDADEVWPVGSLRNISKYLEDYSIVNGFWKTLSVDNDKLYLHDYLNRGAVAWNTKRFELHRIWPREKLRNIGDAVREEEQIIPSACTLFCYHAVLLNLSSLPYKKNRWKKRAERKDQCDLVSKFSIKNLPFDSNEQLLKDPKFVWYK